MAFIFAPIITSVVKLVPHSFIYVVSVPDMVPIAAPIREFVALRDFSAEHTKHA